MSGRNQYGDDDHRRTFTACRTTGPGLALGTRGRRPGVAGRNDPVVSGGCAAITRRHAECALAGRHDFVGAFRAFHERCGGQHVGHGHGERRNAAGTKRKKRRPGTIKSLSCGPRRGGRTLDSSPCGSVPGGFEMKILIADDEAVSRRMLQRLLTKWGYEVVTVADGKTAWEHLKSPDAPRMALLDWMMPGQNGVDVCREMRKQRPAPYTYILLLTAKDAKESVVEGLESGADDYLTKPFHPQELRARLRVGIRLLNLEDTLVEAREAMRFKATHDALTGVWNRGTILETLDREITRSRREGASLGVLLGDVDRFKSVNDIYGHLTGDQVLREATRRMQASVRPYDAVGRYGGEEFLVFLPGCDAAETAAKAEQLRATIEQQPMETPSGPLRITISLGGVANANWPDNNANQLLQMIDAALYRAKEEGRNRGGMAGAGGNGGGPTPPL